MGPDPIFLVQTLYLPPTTGSIRMPATRMPAGLRRSEPPVGISGGWAVSADAADAVRVAPNRTDAADAAKRLRRFIFPLEAFDGGERSDWSVARPGTARRSPPVRHRSVAF